MNPHTIHALETKTFYKLWFCLNLSNVTDMKHSPAHDPRDEQDGNNNDNGKSKALVCKFFDVSSPCYLITLILITLIFCCFLHLYSAGFSPWGIVLIGSFSAGAFITLLFCSVRKIKR